MLFVEIKKQFDFLTHGAESYNQYIRIRAVSLISITVQNPIGGGVIIAGWGYVTTCKFMFTK